MRSQQLWLQMTREERLCMSCSFLLFLLFYILFTCCFIVVVFFKEGELLKSRQNHLWTISMNKCMMSYWQCIWVCCPNMLAVTISREYRTFHYFLVSPLASSISPPVSHLHDASNPIWRITRCSPVITGVCMCARLCIVFPDITVTLSSLPDMMDGENAIKQRPAQDFWHPTAGTE